MDNMINWIRTIQRNKLFYVLAAIQFIFLILYARSSNGVEKLVGFRETIRFFIKVQSYYLVYLILGSICWIISAILIVSIILEIPFIKDSIDDRYSYNRIKLKDIDRNIYIANTLIAVVLFLGTWICLKFLFELTLIAIVIAIILITFFNLYIEKN